MSLPSAARRYLTSIRSFDGSTRMVLASQGVAALSGGVWGVLANLYLLRLGYGPEFIGLANFVIMATTGAASLPGGEIGRRFGMRRTIAWSATASGVLFGAFVAAWLVPAPIRAGWLIGTAFLAGIANGVQFVCYTPLLADLSTEGQRGNIFSIGFALSTSLSLFGALLGGILPGLAAITFATSADGAPAYGVSLLVAMATLLPSALLVLWAREPRTAARHADGSRPLAAAGAEMGLRPTRALLGAGAVMFCSWLGLGTVVTYWNVYLDQSMHLATTAIGSISAITQLVAIPVSLAAPLVMARLSPRRTYPLALLGIAVSIAVLGLAKGPIVAGLAIVTRFAFFSISSPTFATYSQSIVPPRWRGTMAGVVNTAYAGGFSVIALVGGYLVAGAGFGALFAVGAAMVALAAGLYWLLMGRRAH